MDFAEIFIKLWSIPIKQKGWRALKFEKEVCRNQLVQEEKLILNE